MIGFKNDSIGLNESETQFDKLKTVSIDRMGKNIPYYGFDLPVHDEKECGGDCFEYVSQYYEITW